MRTIGPNRRVVTCLVAAALFGGPVGVLAQAESPAAGGSQSVAGGPTDTTPRPEVPITNADLARIRQALDTAPALNLDDDQLRFYVQILAQQPNVADFFKGYDLMNGPTRFGNPMSHQEFLDMVTPRELHSSGGITAVETLQFALTNWLGQALVKRAIEDLQNAKTQREVQDIRDRIDRELAALRSADAH